MEWGDPAELDVWKAIVADFEAANPNIKVNVEVSDWDSYWTKLKTLLAANTPPDVFAMDAPLYLDYQSRGVLLNLQPYIDSNPGMLDGLFPNTLTAYQTPDGYFGLPRDFQTIVVFYNKDMFDKAGVAYPKSNWTYDDLRATAKALTKDTNGDGKIDQFGYVIDPWDFEPGMSEIIWAYGGDLINADHTKTLIGEPNARTAFQFLHDMMFIDHSIPDPNTSQAVWRRPVPFRQCRHDRHGSLGRAGLLRSQLQVGCGPDAERSCRAGHQRQQRRVRGRQGQQEPGCGLCLHQVRAQHGRPDPPG